MKMAGFCQRAQNALRALIENRHPFQESLKSAANETGNINVVGDTATSLGNKGNKAPLNNGLTART